MNHDLVRLKLGLFGGEREGDSEISSISNSTSMPWEAREEKKSIKVFTLLQGKLGLC
jgi:hypothetical protein